MPSAFRSPEGAGHSRARIHLCAGKFPGTTVGMKRIALLFALCVSALSAQDWAKQKLEKSTRHREWVTVKHDGRSVEAYVAYPEVANKAPVVLVIHENFV